jgi:hypothetical protein
VEISGEKGIAGTPLSRAEANAVDKKTTPIAVEVIIFFIDILINNNYSEP